MSTELLEAPAPADAINTKPIVYGIATKRIAELSSMYMGLKVNGVDDKTGLEVVHKARITVRDHRTDIEKTRKALKADVLEFGRRVDAEAQRLTALLEPIEAHLEAEESRIAAEKKRLREEADRKRHEATLARMNALLAVGFTGLNYVQAQDLSEERFAAVLNEATEAHRVAQEKAAAEKAERQRLAEVERQRLEAEKAEQARVQAEEDARRKAEAEQLAKERAELDRQRREQQAESDRIAAERRKLAEEQAAKELERTRELHRVELAEKNRIEAADRARVEAERKAEQAAAAKAKREEQLRVVNHFGERLPDDVGEAFEQFKLVVMRHRAQGWADISQGEMLAAIDVLRVLAADE